MFATSVSEKKPILTGVNFNLSDKTLTCIATDSYRLSQSKIDLNNNFKDFNITIPNKSLEELLKIIDQFDDWLEVYFSNNKL